MSTVAARLEAAASTPPPSPARSQQIRQRQERYANSPQNDLALKLGAVEDELSAYKLQGAKRMLYFLNRRLEASLRRDAAAAAGSFGSSVASPSSLESSGRTAEGED